MGPVAPVPTSPGNEPPGDPTVPVAPDLRGSLKPAGELPERRARRREVRFAGVDQSLAPIIERAVALVAGVLEADAEGGQRVVVEAARSVTWSDSSCGCPEPGRAYPQVPVDGVYVRLRAGGRELHVHGGGRRGLFLCELGRYDD